VARTARVVSPHKAANVVQIADQAAHSWPCAEKRIYKDEAGRRRDRWVNCCLRTIETVSMTTARVRSR
jgi:hypothetical protein